MVTIAKPAATTILSVVSSVAGGASTALSSSFDTQNDIQLTAEVTLTFGAATAGAMLYVYGSHDDAWSGNEVAYDVHKLDLSASVTVQIMKDVKHGPRYIKMKVTNLDASIAITNVSIAVQPQTVA